MKPLNMHGHANTWAEELVEVAKERDQLRAVLEAARTEIERLKMLGQTFVAELSTALVQSRATEAELRAEIEALKKRLPTPECRLDEWFSGGCPCDCHPAAKAALDAQEPRT